MLTISTKVRRNSLCRVLFDASELTVGPRFIAAATREVPTLDFNNQQPTNPRVGGLRKRPSLSKMLSKYPTLAPGHTRSNPPFARSPRNPPMTTFPRPVRKATSTASLNKFRKPDFVPIKSTAGTVKNQFSTLNQTTKPKVAPAKPSGSESKSPTGSPQPPHLPNLNSPPVPRSHDPRPWPGHKVGTQGGCKGPGGGVSH